MPKIFVNQSGVQSQCSAIASSTSSAEQSATSYSSQTTAHQEGLDGAARAGAVQFGQYAKQATNAACATASNLRAYLESASQTVSSVDQANSRRFIPQLRLGR